MENHGGAFQSSNELRSEEISRIKSGYVRGALVRDLIISVIAFALVGAGCFFLLNVSTMIAIVILCISSVIGLFCLVGVITELVILGYIGRGDFTWTSGEVERYTVHTVNRTTYLYAVVADNFCNTWANPFYGKGTEVYLLNIDSGLIKQKVMVSK